MERSRRSRLGAASPSHRHGESVNMLARLSRQPGSASNAIRWRTGEGEVLAALCRQLAGARSHRTANRLPDGSLRASSPIPPGPRQPYPGGSPRLRAPPACLAPARRLRAALPLPNRTRSSLGCAPPSSPVDRIPPLSSRCAAPTLCRPLSSLGRRRALDQHSQTPIACPSRYHQQAQCRGQRRSAWSSMRRNAFSAR